MASWFTRALDRVTPWNRGGEVERRKKREEEERQRQAQQNNRSSNAPGGLRVGVAQPTQNITVPQAPKPQRPDNLFQDLNQSLMLGQRPKTTLDIIKENAEVAKQPQPGEVIRPQLKVTNAPQTQTLRMPDGRAVRDIPETEEDRVKRILDSELDRGKSWEDIARDNGFKVEGVRDYSKATRPNYGIKEMERPKQSLGNRFRDVFDANTEADKFRRQEGNAKAVAEGRPNEVKDLTLRNPGNIVSRTPIVGHVTKMVNTAGVQIPQVGLTVQQKFATDEYGEASRAYTEARKTGDPIRIGAAERRLNAANKRLQDIQKDIDFVESKFQKNKGGWFNAGTLYDEEAAKRGDVETAIKDIALPTAVTALDLYTLGKGSTVSEALKQGGKGALRTQTGNIAKMTAGNYLSGDLSARAEGATGWDPIKSGSINAVLGSAPDIGLPLIGRSFKNRVLPKIMRGRGVNPADVVEELDDAAISASAEAANQALRPRPIRVATDIPVKVDPTDIVEVPVVRRPTGRPLIKELEGDFNFPTFEQLQEIRIADTKKAADVVNSAARPDMRIEGVTPRESGTFKLDDTAIKTSQDDLIDQYAGFLRDVGEGNGTQLIPDGEGGYYRTSNNYRPGMGSGRVTKEQWREEAERQLRAGQADPAIQQAFNDAADPEVQSMLSKGDTTEEAPIGRPIEVKEAKGIPVRDETVVPTDLPETPGQVRVTTATDPMAAKTEAVANAPVVATPPPLPREVQEVLDNPKQFSKRQVAAARNQRKLARQMAKTQEDTAAAMERINNAKVTDLDDSTVTTIELNGRKYEMTNEQMLNKLMELQDIPKAERSITVQDQINRLQDALKANRSQVSKSSEDFAPTGKFGKGAKGDAYEKVSRVSEEQLGRQEMANRSVEDLVDELAGKSKIEPGDQRRIEQAMKNMAEADPDNYRKNPLWNLLNNKNISNRRKAAQILALGNRTIRKSATSDTLSNRWLNKVTRVVDGSKVSDVDLKAVQKANDTFVEARDNAARAAEQYKRTHSKADLDAYEAAQKAADKADIEAKTAEVTAAKNTFKGARSENGAQVINDLEKEAELNMMDATTASQLSGPATGMRNLYGTELAGVENRLFGNIRAKVTNKLFGENVGGYSREGARAGRKEGFGRMRGDAKRRAEYSGLNPLKRARSFATSINSLGESSLYSQKQSRLYKYYENQLKKQGVTGERLKNDTKFLSMTDPDNMGDQFMDAAMKSSGLTGIYQKSRQIELQLAQSIADKLDNVLPPGASNAIAKGITRIALGYPTATGNFIVQSGRRATLGLPSFGEMGWKLARGDKAGAAQAFDRGLKEAGGGAAGIGLGMALANAGLITGFYPEDEDERQRWADEGKSELSINIGGTWHPIPQGFGMFGLPLIVGSTLETGGADEVANVLTDREKIFSLLPADQLYGVMKIAAGGSTENQDKSFMASTIRSLIPVGSFLNQTAKGLDQTANDTTTKDFWSNVMDQVISGIPGHQAVVDIPDKTSSTGEPIKNPNLLQTYLGARSVEQPSGIENSKKIDAQISDALKGIDQYGLLNDPNMEGVLEEKGLEAYNKLKAGKNLDESDVKALKEGLVKGVSSEGTDTAYLERGEYDTNLAVLKLKRDLMKEDKTTKPSQLKDIDLAIKRGEVYKDNQIPYDMISDYKSIGVEEWRNMGDPEHDDYDPEMYQQLWAIDELMTKAGASYRKGKLDKQKYYQKESKGRGGAGSRGGSSASSLSSEFGQLKAGEFSPQVQQYESIDQRSGSIPIIRTVRPNIVHKIGSSG